MFLFDNVISLRYVEQGSQVGRALTVLKMRNSQHERTLSSVSITNEGLVVGAELDAVTGRLGWSALRVQEDPPAAVSPAAPVPG